ncbi:hypothetical protein ACTMTF_38015 [Nonomuraea sp. ZG12]|uniref:hypothetical protein n=1 Tax=Nonomuraea sp. ZG12 TaxID=3452207 RepID=UPI003F89AE97
MLADRVDALLTGTDGSIAAALLPLREAILATNNAQAALSHLGRSRAHDVLAEIAAGRAPLTHATLDQHGPIIALFARTHLLRRLRRHLNGSALQPGAAYRARAELAASSLFLTHLRRRGRTLATCRQIDLNACIASPRLTID